MSGDITGDEGLWVRTEPDLGGIYRVVVEFTDDRSRFLTRDEAVAYCLALLTVVEYATYDAAVAAQSAKMGMPPDVIGQVVTDLRRDRPPVDDAVTAPARFVPGVSAKTADPFIGIYVDGEQIGQIHPEAVAEHAVFVLRALVCADLDGVYLRYLTGTVGTPEMTARAVIDDLSNHRQEKDPER